MPAYTMRLTWPDDPDRTNDFVFRVDGKDCGRCYFMPPLSNTTFGAGPFTAVPAAAWKTR